MRMVCLLMLGGFFLTARAQEQVVAQLQLTETVPAELLASRAVVIYDPSFKKSELDEIQKSFAQTGIDAVLYIEQDVVFAGKDITLAYANHLATREIRFLVFINKPAATTYRMITTAFNNKPSLVDAEQGAWEVSASSLREMLDTANRNAWISQKKQNFLINDIPETTTKVNPITGKRAEFFSLDLKADEMAVPYFNDATLDSALKKVFTEIYPFKYKLVSPATDDAELRKKGSILTLCVIHSRGSAAKKILGYDLTKAETAYASTTYTEALPQVKTIPAETPVYKFYIKHIPSGNIFLGTKWDADVTMEQALRNHIKGYKAELKME